MSTDTNLIFETNVLGDCNRGWLADQVIIMRGDIFIGLFTINYMTTESYNDWNPTVFNYLSHHGGWCGFPHTADFQSLTDRALESKQHYSQFSVAACRKMRDSIAWHEFSIDYSSVRKQPDTAEEMYKSLQDIEQKLLVKYKSEIKKFKNIHVDHAIMDFVMVEHELELDVFANAAISAANWFSKRNMPLRFPSTISAELRQVKCELLHKGLITHDQRNNPVISTT